MISGLELAEEFEGVKRVFTDQEGVARRVSSSLGGLVGEEESGRVADVLMGWID